MVELVHSISEVEKTDALYSIDRENVTFAGPLAFGQMRSYMFA